MHRILLALVLVAMSCSHQTITPEQRRLEVEKLNAFFERSFKESLERHPEYATYVGERINYDKLEDISDEARERELEIGKKELKELRSFNFDALDEQSQISYRLFEEGVLEEIESWKYRYHRFPVNQMFGRHSSLPSFMINTHQVDSLADAMAYVSRLGQFEKQMTTLVQLLETRRQKGIIAPLFVYPKAIGDCQNILTGKPFTKGAASPLYQDFLKKISALKISTQQRAELVQEAEKNLLESVKPGYEKLIVKLQELEKIAPQQANAINLPDGKAFYKNSLKNITTTDMTPDEIHELGLRETARIHSEMRAIMGKVGFKGTLEEFFQYVKTDKKFRYPNTAQGKQQFLQDSRKIISVMKSKLPNMFGLFPKADLIVKAVEPYREKSAGEAFYDGPSEDGKRPGTYYVNLYDMKQVAKHELEALAYHEGIPGHHMQIAITTELTGLPRFRKYTHYTAFVEGWGLYAEKFPKDFGFYQDPFSDFGRLSMELWRSGRLVVDTGLHSKGWSMEQAIKWLDENTPSTHAENEKAIQRYVVMPGQATAYMIGMLKILDLKEKAQKDLAQKFDLKQFHDQVLKNGPLPLKVLEERMSKWVSEQKKI